MQKQDAQDNDYSDDDLFSISSFGADLSFRELLNMYDDDELIKPKMQRNYIWEKREASRFIETILLGLPIPSIFLAKTNDERYYIVDGYQRIRTVHDFCKMIFPKDGTNFKLTANVNPRWKGKTFAQLTDVEQRRIKNTTIHSIVFKQEKPKDDDTSMYQIFERINTGGRSLAPQEIRNCVYHNKLNDLLFKLNENPSWRKLYKLKNPDPRMRDIEFILRFLMISNSQLNGDKTISIKKALNLFMDIENRKIDVEEALERYSYQFSGTMNYLIKIGKNIFDRVENEKTKRFDPIMFDALSVAVNKYMIKYKKEPVIEKEQFLERKAKILNDEDFKKLINDTRRPTENSLKARFEIAYKHLFLEDEVK